ncbi:unnamed protein product [Wuchereria bancrofti]|uniref:Uncharacterized protein n=1 Tax=Wuchereria bancrofti TaxID=6293 RepID=A0A3P7DMD5_WUCBA|nr:unnamed protein product [Wuchereria bancrofti]
MSRLQALHIQNDAMLTNTFISVQENTKQLCSDECVANDTISSLIILSEKILAQCNSERIARILLLLVNDTLNLIEWNLIDNSNYCNIPKNE